MWYGKLDPSVEQGKATPVHLTKDDVITITVTGKANYGGGDYGPDGNAQNKNPRAILPGTNVGAVLMQIGKNGELKEIGAGVSKHHFQEEGEVTFLYNDVPGEYGNNSGLFEIKIERETPEKLWSGPLEANAVDGVKTGVTVSEGDVISVAVTGSATNQYVGGAFGPDGNPDEHAYQSKYRLPGANLGAILMQIGSGQYTVVGSALANHTVKDGGQIAFFYNDEPYEYAMRGNRGSFQITVTK